jgi:Fe-S-cluster containining protein
MGEESAPESTVPELDVRLLAGFGFGCRPGCGLCCFTSPRLEGDDERRLRKGNPNARIVADHGVSHLAARPDGGACQFLRELRCAVHDSRPAPCREFPISVHVGTRLQATVVLSCPGLGLESLEKFDPAVSSTAPAGLDTELASVRDRLTAAAEHRRIESERRRRRVVRALRTEGRWQEDEEVRRTLHGRRLLPTEAEYSPDSPPRAQEGLELLPLYYDGRRAPVALAEGLGAWEALEIEPEGGSRPLGLAVPPDRLPSLDAGAERMLGGYLRYWVERDGFLAAVQLEMLSRPSGTVLEAALEDLHGIASNVIARGAVRAKLRGEDGVRLTREDVERGIRSTDQDWLDRPTWGSRL